MKSRGGDNGKKKDTGRENKKAKKKNPVDGLNSLNSKTYIY